MGMKKVVSETPVEKHLSFLGCLFSITLDQSHALHTGTIPEHVRAYSLTSSPD
jgi:hypothetical protein